MDSIISLSNILKQNTFNEKEFNRFIKTKGTQGFILHQKNMGNEINIETIKKELNKVIVDESYQDRYDFYLIKRNIKKIHEDIKYIKENGELIVNKALKEIYKIVPKDMKISTNIYLYIGGTDGGFTINRRKVFINYGKYIGQSEELIKILSHELYHSRHLSLKNRLILMFKMISKTNRFIYESIGKSIEEGIACLVQHGSFLKKDDPIGTLTRRNIVFIKDELDLLNNILLNIKNDQLRYKDIRKLNIYVIGYHIVRTVYNNEGVFVLDDWTVNLEYRKIMRKYVEICKKKDLISGFTKEIEEWINLG